MSVKQAKRIYAFGPFRLDATKRLLLRDGETLPLTPKCFDILLALVERSGEVISKESLINRVWPDSFVEEGNLTYNISILRKALGERAGEHQYIATVPGRGYQFVEVVEELLNEPKGAEATESSPTPPVVQKKDSRSQVEAAFGRGSLVDSLVTRVLQNKRAALIAALMLVIAGAAVSLGLYRLISRNESQTHLRVPFQKMQISRLTTTGKATVAAISPDGKYVAHAMGGRSQQSLWLRHIATGSDKEIIPTAPVDYTALTFSPDGNYICFLRAEAVEPAPLYRVPVLGGSIQKLRNDVDAAITFSPDGRQIAYIRGYPERNEAVLITANADGTDERTLITGRPLWDLLPPRPGKFWMAWGPAWSPDGGVIAFALRKDEPDTKYWNVMTVRIKDHSEQQITFQKWASVGQMTWLSDGSGLIVAAADNDSYQAEQIWHVSYPNGEVHRITNDTNTYSGIRLTADSTALVTVRTEQNLNIWVASDDYASRAAQITSNNFDGLTGISWTPDGRIVYTTITRGSSNISIMNADGTSQELLSVDAGDNFRPSVSPDGRYIVFVSNRTGNRCVWRMDIDGSNPKQLTYGIDARLPEITPDGQWVFYADVGSFNQGLWKVSIEGGNQVQLTDYGSRAVAVSPDGKQIVTLVLDEQATRKRWRAAIILSGGGPPAKVLDLPSVQMVRWTLDGRALTYLDTRNGVSNIWAQPLDGSAPKPVTHFTTDQILAYAWSRDGKRLACARGNQTSDVVLLTDLR